MTSSDKTPSESGAARPILSRVKEACRHVGESQDYVVALRKVVANACSLTGARYGSFVSLGTSRAPGATPAERRCVEDLPTKPTVFDFLKVIDEPSGLTGEGRRSGDGPARDDPQTGTFLEVPVRHQGATLGIIYVAQKQGGQEFTREDEEILAMFIAHVSPVIAQLRRSEQLERQ